MTEYNQLLRKLKLYYPQIKVVMQTNSPYLLMTATCSITDNDSIRSNGKYSCEDSYLDEPDIADKAKTFALNEALAYAGINLDAKDVRYMTKLTTFRPTKQYASRVSWKRTQGV